jgi:hypothetical protein
MGIYCIVINDNHKYDCKKLQEVFHCYMNEKKTCAAIGMYSTNLQIEILLSRTATKISFMDSQIGIARP